MIPILRPFKQMLRKIVRPQRAEVHYSFDYEPEWGRKSAKAERLAGYCLGEFQERAPPACTEDSGYLKEKFVLLFKTMHRAGVLRNIRGSDADDQKQIVEALISQRAAIPDNLSCWLLRTDDAGKLSRPEQGLHIVGVRPLDRRHNVLVPTANRDRYLGPSLARQMEALRADWIPWSEKSDTAWWGGALTGDNARMDGLPLLTRRDVLTYFQSTPSKHVHLHLAEVPEHALPIPDGVQLRGRFTKRDAFRHKCLILLPGNDIASGSSWYFAGNSVVMMPKPHMDHILYFEMEPWEHYVPLENEPADILIKLQWVLDNESEARRIVERSHERLRWLCGPEYLWACNEVLRRIAPAA